MVRYTWPLSSYPGNTTVRLPRRFMNISHNLNKWVEGFSAEHDQPAYDCYYRAIHLYCFVQLGGMTSCFKFCESELKNRWDWAPHPQSIYLLSYLNIGLIDHVCYKGIVLNSSSFCWMWLIRLFHLKVIITYTCCVTQTKIEHVLCAISKLSTFFGNSNISLS